MQRHSHDRRVDDRMEMSPTGAEGTSCIEPLRVPPPGSTIRILAPGAVSVGSLEDAHLILDPAIHYVQVLRPHWVNGAGREILSALSRIQISLTSDPSSYGCSWEGEGAACLLPDWRTKLYPKTSAVDAAWEALHRDALSIRKWLSEITETKHPHSTLRLELRDCAPGMHFDAQAITCAVPYFGGGSMVQLLNGQMFQLPVGEIGIWKGRMYEVPPDAEGAAGYGFFDGGIPLNPGQAVLHGAPESAGNHPRMIGLHDIRDGHLPAKVLKGFAPWASVSQE